MKRTALLLAAALALAAAACDRTETVLNTTTSAPPGGTSTTAAPATTTPSTTAPDAAGATAAAQPIDQFDIVYRASTDAGEALYVVIPPGDYSDVSLQGLIGGLVDEFAPAEIHVFDAAEAADALLKEADSRTDAEQATLEQHYLVSLTEGNQVVFQGPFSEFGSYTHGS
ncbi:MAG: hypothetical protein ACRDVM_07005 [Acidimicrobiia bacterium]